MHFGLAKVFLVALVLGLNAVPSVTKIASAESEVCKDGTSCSEDSEPSDADLEDSCSDEAETI
jgi:hypothetical protein